MKEGISLKERARRAWQFRHDKRLEARSFMRDKDEVEMLQARDMHLYGTPDGPTFEFLVKRLRDAGLKGNEVYEAIIQSSERSDPAINKLLGL
jgi:hypothetical protein